ncbi:hypothetical protein P872_03040 [Rhodonellum psychrophilum GCM71 = DSM 17998]|uniref:Uncharacterized protein n=1 Tax=Rhodonellum psychrophilum GCM71 = DSM 17998 TaxID=1123057 RepID=U5C1C4_9BACT|nr:hypothetical protein P872_03040 [Rhodonellum psychrophilum GCM71 = DSM 17998]
MGFRLTTAPFLVLMTPTSTQLPTIQTGMVIIVEIIP